MLSALFIAAALLIAQAPDPGSVDRPPTPDEMDALQQLYDSSCGSRGYAQYDEVCILITKQIDDAKKAAARSARQKAKLAPKAVPPSKSDGSQQAPAATPTIEPSKAPSPPSPPDKPANG